MKPLIWDEGLALGDERIDRQHRHLFDIWQRAASGAESDTVLKELFAYAVFHFAEEEALMATVRYPEAEAHAARHREFLVCLEELRGKGPEAVLEAFADWIEAHLRQEDQKFGTFLRVADPPSGP